MFGSEYSSWFAVETKLGNRKSRKVGNNTYLKRLGEHEIGLLYHSTFVLKFTYDYVEYDTGGWYTVTTKARFNDYGPARVYSHKGRWYFFGPDRDENGDMVRRPYADGTRVTYDGEFLNAADADIDAEQAKENDKLKKRIAAYAKKFSAHLASCPMEFPNAGDCFFCNMMTTDGKTLGDSTADREHLLSHIEEDYFVASLAYHAVKEKGYRFPEIILGYDPESGTIGGNRMFFAAGVRTAIRDYLKARLLEKETGAKPMIQK